MKKSLFVYIDYTFSFGFGHYINIFSNLYAIAGKKNHEFCLIHDHWKYYNSSEEDKFEQFPGIIRIQSDRKSLISKIINNLKLNDYDDVTVYTYKGSIEMIAELISLHDLFKSHQLETQVIHTLFTIPTEHLNIESNTFNSEFVETINANIELIKNRNFQLAFDVSQSIWNRYIPSIHFLPPPLLKNNAVISRDKDHSSIGEITLAIDIWNINHSPTYRFESIENIKELINALLKANQNLYIKLKIADSSFNLKDARHDYHLHPRVEVIRFLDENSYEEYLDEIDIYLLQYAPLYYKNKSSGHLLELLQRGITTIGTINTFLENYIDNDKLLYEFGNVSDLIETSNYTVQHFPFPEKSETPKVNELITAWSQKGFNQKVFQKTKTKDNRNNMKKTDKPLVILGNGPSLKGFDFSRLSPFDTIGMNAAYRYWDRINWYPTYYICLDTIVVKSHHNEIKRLIDESDENGIQKFFLREDFFEFQPQFRNHPKVITYEKMVAQNRLIFDCVHVTTGSFSARLGINEGYTSLLMLGIDENYVNFIKESKLKENITLEITTTPEENPNYFFKDYQQKGDLYQIANHDKVYICNCRHCNGEERRGENLHVEAWRFVLQDIEDNRIINNYGPLKIINCNPNSNVKYFPFMSFGEAIQLPVEPKNILKEKPIAQPIPNEKFTSQAIILPMITFLGKSKMSEKKKTFLSVLNSLEKFTLSISLKSFYNKSSFSPYSDTAPPMPFIIGPFALFDMGDVYKISIKEEGKAKDLVSFENEYKWNTIEIKRTPGELQVFVNAKEIFSGELNTLEMHRDMISLGCGFLHRYWRGEFDKIKLLDASDKCVYKIDSSTLNDLLKKEKFTHQETNTPKESASVLKEEPTSSQIPDHVVFFSSKETCQDRWVTEMLQNKQNGFFVDIGASDGRSANNSLTLEKYFGWKGILIEGNSFSYQKLVKNRPGQICVNAIIAEEEKEVEWRENDKVLTRSGINSTLPPDNDQKSWRVGDKIIRKTQKLEIILDQNNTPKQIDFLTIDIEGGEVNALKNFPFNKYKVRLISAEVGYQNREEFEEIMNKNGFENVINPYCTVAYEKFYINKKLD